jgi:hypothetical protein
MKPTFLFVGPDKTGSSWMHFILEAHPECFVPKAKDIYYFDRFYDRGFEWYLKHFDPAPANATAIGELSHDYLFSEPAATRIRQDLPEVKILICLRNPVDRSLSQYQYMRRGGEVGASFDEAVDRYPKIVENSLYLRWVKLYLDMFGPDQVKILVFDDLMADPVSFGRDMLRFLDVDPDVDLPFDTVVRQAAMARSARLSRSLKWGAEAARALGVPNLVGRAKSSRLAGLAYRDVREGEAVTLSDQQRRSLWERFESELAELSELAGRDLELWAPKERH